MTNEQAKQLAITLMGDYGLFNMGWKFAFNNRTSSFGLCRYRVKMIELSSVLTPNCTDANIRNTIIHEIAHALTPGHGHDHVWRMKFISMGGDGKRCGEMDDHQIGTSGEKNLIEERSNFRNVCAVHGVVGYSMRKWKRETSCSKCSRRFDRRYLLTQQEITKSIGNKDLSLPQQTNRFMTPLIIKDNNVVSIKTGASQISVRFGNKVQAESKGKYNDKDATFVKRIVTFLNDFLNVQKAPNQDELVSVLELLQFKSWRSYSNDLRRTFNKYMVRRQLMTNAEFQAKWFYEGTMEGRTTHGANAPWLDGQNVIKKTVPMTNEPVAAKNNEGKSVRASKSVTKYLTDLGNYELDKEWDRKNYEIAKRLND